MSVVISEVEKKSVCGRKGLSAGDKLLSVNGNDINDVLDYRFYADEEDLRIAYENGKGHVKKCHIRHSEGVDSLGLGFETYLMDRQRHCKNACIFCFIDQMPPGMRESLYFKDDDSRLSFLFGNYITLTNLTEHDAQRIIRMHISPLNASVHTMDPALRVRMMKNPNAGTSLAYLKRFSDAGIAINAQLVLCPGINDGDALDYSLEKLSELDSVASIAAVPVGLTKYREGLYPLESYTPDGAADVIDRIDRFNAALTAKKREKLAYPSDEFYQIAGREIPSLSYYGDFPQLDNGVGLYALTEHDFLTALAENEADQKKRTVSIATGRAAYPLISALCRRFCEKYPASSVSVFCIENTFFGEKVTVAGLLTGGDLFAQLNGKLAQGSLLMIPSVMLKGKDEPVFLDDMTVDQLSEKLCVSVMPVDCSGDSLFYQLYALL